MSDALHHAGDGGTDAQTAAQATAVCCLATTLPLKGSEGGVPLGCVAISVTTRAPSCALVVLSRSRMRGAE